MADNFYALTQDLWAAAAILWWALTLIVVPFIGGYLTKLAWEFFTTKTEYPDAWPFPKEFMPLYKWGGKINYEIDTVYELEGKPWPFGLVKLDNLSWKKVSVSDGTTRYEVVMTFVGKTLDEISITSIGMKESTCGNCLCEANGFCFCDKSVILPPGQKMKPYEPKDIEIDAKTLNKDGKTWDELPPKETSRKFFQIYNRIIMSPEEYERHVLGLKRKDRKDNHNADNR